MEQKANDPAAKRELIILENEILMEPKKQHPGLTAEHLKDLFIIKGMTDLAERVNDLLIDKGRVISARTPWIKDLANAGSDYSILFSISNGDKVEDCFFQMDLERQDFIFYFINVPNLWVKFCNKVILSNVTILFSVSILFKEPIEAIEFEKFYYTISVNSKWLESETNSKVQCTGESQIISMNLPEIWPGDVITISIDWWRLKDPSDPYDDPYRLKHIPSWRLYYAKILEWG